MRTLAIDTSTDRLAVALWDGHSCVARTLEPVADFPDAHPRQAGRAPSQHAERMFGLIDDVLSSAGWNKQKLDLLACCIGPGSFTGLRVGLASAKGMALALDRPIVGVGSLEAMARALVFRNDASLEDDEVVMALLDAHKGEVFWAAYAPSGALLAGPGHMARLRFGDIWRSLQARKIVVVGELSDELAPAEARVVRAPETDRPDAAVIARLAVDKLERKGGDDLDALEPIYVRPPDITPKLPT
jgi:tRNA threonylcarbamoyladenosine biosynthesis protein TsaB